MHKCNFIITINTDAKNNSILTMPETYRDLDARVHVFRTLGICFQVFIGTHDRDLISLFDQVPSRLMITTESVGDSKWFSDLAKAAHKLGH